MPNTQDIIEKVEAVLIGGMSVERFQDWFGPYTWNIHKRSGAAVQDLVYQIDLLLSEYTSDDLSESELRKELEDAISPFVVSTSFRVEARSGSSPNPDTLFLVRKGPQCSIERLAGSAVREDHVRFA
jgi:hypothetical protein